MADETTKRWIVLLNKVPRGPLTETEIRALLKEGIVRHNDIAFLVPAPGADSVEKQASEWKLLWQFTEFDRRLEEDGNRTSDAKSNSWAGTGTPQAPGPPKHPDRRRQMTPDEAEVKTREVLPPELLDIAPEELVVHSTSQETFSMGDPVEAPEQRSFDLHMPSPRVMGALAGIVLLIFVVATLRPGGAPKVAHVPTGSAPSAVDSRAEVKAIGSRKAPTARVAPRPAGTIVSPSTVPEARLPASRGRIEENPSAPDRGEIEPSEEDEEDSYASGTDDGEEVSPPASKLRRPAKARRPRVLSDDRNEPDEPDDRDQDRDRERGGGNSRDDRGEED